MGYISEGRPSKFAQPVAETSGFQVPDLKFDKGKGKIVEMDRMRQMIADHMVYSKHTSPHVTAYVEADPRYPQFIAKLEDMVTFLLPNFRNEGKAHLAIGIGCTGGQHRSVAVTEVLGKALANKGWRVSIRHRELERRGAGDG